MLAKAVSLHQNGQLAEAALLYRKILERDPNNADVLHLLGVIQFQTKKPSEAVALINRAIKLDSTNAGFFSNRGLAFIELSRLKDALVSFDRALTLAPDFVEALNNRGNVLKALHRFEDALASYDRALAITPGFVGALTNRGNLLSELGRFDEALASYDRAVRLSPNHTETHYNRGNVLRALERFDDALASYDRALAINPDYPDVLNNRGLALHALKRSDEALASYDRALGIKPNQVEILYNRGNVLRELKRFGDALASYDRALAIKPDFFEAISNRGGVLHQLRRFDDALVGYDRALKIKADHAETLCNRAIALQEMARFEESLSSIDRALAINPDDPEALNSRGLALQALKRFEEALASFDHALSVKPDYMAALNNSGTVLRALHRFDNALAYYDRALAIDPASSRALGNRAGILQIQGEVSQTTACLRHAVAASPDDASLHSDLIFALNFDSAATAEEKQFERSQWDQAHARKFSQHIKPHTNDSEPERRLRIGYVTSHFRRQAATYCFGGVILNHDPKLFEVICYSDTLEDDDVTSLLRARADRWRLTRGLSDDQLAELIRKDRIDILVDLVGHMAGHRLTVFARKPAPIQVTAWGEPTGTGLTAMDYLLADPVLVPESERGLLSERVVNLPNFLGYWTPEPLPEPGELPTLTNGNITLGSFNRLEKITHPTIRSWVAILRKLPTAHLVLKDGALEDLGQRARLEEAFAAEGIAVERLKLIGGSDRESHFMAYRKIDIALDPFPHSGGMTTLDCLWMGVPVVTWRGQTISSRLAAACLTASGLSDFIADSPESYVDLVVAKAAELEALSRLRSGLRTRISTSEFGNCLRYTSAVEAAYREMWQDWCAGRTASPNAAS